MAVDLTKIAFFSNDPIDKIVQQGEVTIVNDGNTTSTGTTTGPQAGRVVSSTTTNTYGRAALARARWSIDGGTSWQSLETEIIYGFTITFTDIPVTSDPLKAIDSAITVGCTDSTVYFFTVNGKHGNVSRTSGAPNDTGYTPTSRTFTIQYVLYERE